MLCRHSLVLDYNEQYFTLWRYVPHYICYVLMGLYSTCNWLRSPLGSVGELFNHPVTNYGYLTYKQDHLIDGLAPHLAQRRRRSHLGPV